MSELQAGLVDQISRSLSHARGVENVVREGARVAVPSLADIIVTVLAGRQNGDELYVVSSDPTGESHVSELIRPLLPAIRRVAKADHRRGRDFRWLKSVSSLTTRFLNKEPALIRFLSELHVQSLMVVPLRTGGSWVGGMAFARVQGQPFHAVELATAQVIGHRIATSIETADLYEATADERRHRAKLESALDKWTRVFDVAGWGAAIVDGSDCRIDAVNPAFARLHGFPEVQALVGRLYSDLLPPEHAEEVLDWHVHQDSSPYESLHVRADGSLFPVLTDVTPLETESSSTSFVVTVQDLTELKRAEERLRRAQRLEAVGRLAGGVAHEVNNMMTIILGFSDLLSRSGSVPPERQRDIEEIRKAATRAGKTTQQLLAFSRQQILQLADLEINDVVSELLPALRLLLPANIQLETTLTPFPVMVRADRAQLDQVLINLAFNARDAMPQGGTVRLMTDSRWIESETGRALIGIPIQAARYATISVVDTGYGMDADTVTQLFEPFFTTKPVGSGTGLGLATVYGIVKQSGGYVWVESTVNKGTSVTVCLPQQETSRQPRSEVPAETQLPECRSGTVLVVEDEDGVRDLARRVLEQQGHRVLEARDGAGVVEILDRCGNDLDLVLTDVIVPDSSTADLQSDVRARRPGLPIVYMSGYSQQEMVERGLVPLEGAFLQKPFTAEELGNLVCRHLEPMRPVVGR